MNYEFGDILDARKIPGIKKFIVIVGEIKTISKNEVMYYKITSRTYTVFKNILVFFNDCITRKDKNFLKFFNKERSTDSPINLFGKLSEAVFFDKDNHYSGSLELDSMVVINSEPKLQDKSTIDTWKKDGKINYRDCLTKLDSLKLLHTIKESEYVSQDKKNKVAYSFNQKKSKFI